MNDLGRAYDKFNNTVYALAGGRGGVKERLADAVVRYLVDTDESDMPENMRGEFHRLMERMTREPSAHEHEGTIHATIRLMSEDEAELITTQILTMRDEVKRAFDAQGMAKPQ